MPETEYEVTRLNSTTVIKTPKKQNSSSTKYTTRRLDANTVIREPVRESDLWYENGKVKISATRTKTSSKNKKGETVTTKEPQGMVAIQEKDPATGKVLKTTYFVEDALNTTGGQKAIDQIVERQAAREESHQNKSTSFLAATGLSNLPWNNQPQPPPTTTTTTSSGGSRRSSSSRKSSIPQWHPPMVDPARPNTPPSAQPVPKENSVIIKNLQELKANPKAGAQQYFESQGGRKTTPQETKSGTVQMVNYAQRDYVNQMYTGFRENQKGQLPKSAVQSQMQVQQAPRDYVRTKFNPYNPLSIVAIGTEYWQGKASEVVAAKENKILSVVEPNTQTMADYFMFQSRKTSVTPQQIQEQEMRMQTVNKNASVADPAIWAGALAFRGSMGVVHSFSKPTELVTGTIQFWGGAAKATTNAVTHPVQTLKRASTATPREQMGWLGYGIETATQFWMYGKTFEGASKAYQRNSPYLMSIPKEGMPLPKFTKNIKKQYEQSVAAQDAARSMTDSMALSERSGGRLTLSPTGEPVARIAGPKPAGLFSGVFGRARERARERAGLPTQDYSLKEVFETAAEDTARQKADQAWKGEISNIQTAGNSAKITLNSGDTFISLGNDVVFKQSSRPEPAWTDSSNMLRSIDASSFQGGRVPFRIVKSRLERRKAEAAARTPFHMSIVEAKIFNEQFRNAKEAYYYQKNWEKSEQMIKGMREQETYKERIKVYEEKPFEEKIGYAFKEIFKQEKTGLEEPGYSYFREFFKDERGDASGFFRLLKDKKAELYNRRSGRSREVLVEDSIKEDLRRSRSGELAKGETQRSLFSNKELNKSFRDGLKDSAGEVGKIPKGAVLDLGRESVRDMAATRVLENSSVKIKPMQDSATKIILDNRVRPELGTRNLTGLGISVFPATDTYTRARSDTRLGIGTMLVPGLVSTLVLREVLVIQGGFFDQIIKTGKGKKPTSGNFGFMLPKGKGDLTESKVAFAYVPSLTALGLNIRGKARGGYGFGLTLRPIQN